MAFLSKEELASEASRLGVNLDDYSSWAEKQKAVFQAQAAEQGAVLAKPKEEPKMVQTHPVKPKLDEAHQNLVNGFKDGKILISHEIPSMRFNPIKYDEPLGEDLQVEEIHVSPDMIKDTGTTTSSTYRIVGRSGRQVIAQSTLPTENVRITFDSARDAFPVVTYNGQSGYLWDDDKIFNVKGLLLESGYFEKYKHLFNGVDYPGNIWLAGTKLFAVSIPLVHYLMSEIEEEERKKL